MNIIIVPYYCSFKKFKGEEIFWNLIKKKVNKISIRAMFSNRQVIKKLYWNFIHTLVTEIDLDRLINKKNGVIIPHLFLTRNFKIKISITTLIGNGLGQSRHYIADTN